MGDARNFGQPEGANHHATAITPVRRQVIVHLKLNGDRVEDVGYQGSGCAISMASSSLMTEVLKGKTVAEAHALFHRFHDLITGSHHAQAAEPVDPEAFERLTVLSGVSEYPMRVKCATLAWHTMEAALQDGADKVTTE
jgi:nitrogen fixation NifU-like protein